MHGVQSAVKEEHAETTTSKKNKRPEQMDGGENKKRTPYKQQ